jgi:hypothetical protein
VSLSSVDVGIVERQDCCATSRVAWIVKKRPERRLGSKSWIVPNADRVVVREMLWGDQDFNKQTNGQREQNDEVNDRLTESTGLCRDSGSLLDLCSETVLLVCG